MTLFAWLVFGTMASAPAPRVELTGWALMNAETFRSGVSAGRALANPSVGLATPFMGQPVQGFSGLLSDGTLGRGRDKFLAMSDNGFGAQNNSYDFVLAWHQITVDWSAHSVSRTGTVEMSDPGRLVKFPIVADQKSYPTRDIPVDARIREGRLLTGYDFDPEGFQRMPDGTFWVSDEFGPFLFHLDAQGRLLSAPVATPNPLADDEVKELSSPQRPHPGAGRVNVGASGGFEGLALDADNKTLWAAVEKAVVGDPVPERRWVLGLDTTTGKWTGDRWAIRMENANHSIGELTVVGPGRFLVIERDQAFGAAARVKRVYLVDSRQRDAAAFARKSLIVDLLDIDDPRDLNGDRDRTFRFPFVTIESIVMENPRSLVLVNDNNFPASSMRRAGRIEGTEFIRIRLPEPLP